MLFLLKCPYDTDRKRILLTFDKDSSDIRAFVPTRSFGIVWIRTKNLDPSEATRRVIDFFESTPSKAIIGKLVVIDRNKIRFKEL